MIHVSSTVTDITPSKSLILGGYSRRHSPSEGINDRLEANIVCIKSEDSIYIMVGIDSLYPPPHLESHINKALPQALQTDETNIFVVSSHTHFAPMLDDTKPCLGKVDKKYQLFVINKICEAVQATIKKEFSPVHFSYGETPSDGAVYRRKKILTKSNKFPFLQKTFASFPNTRKYRDFPLKSLIINDSTNTPIAVIWSYPCHPVGFPLRNSVSADFPGAARDHYRLEIGKNIPIIFFPGFCGNTRPRSLSKKPVWPQFVMEVLNFSRGFTNFTVSDYRSWCEGLGKSFSASVKQGSRIAASEVKTHSIKVPLSELLECKPTTRQITLKAIVLGKNLTLFGASAEVAFEYEQILRNQIPTSKVMFTGCMSDVYGYLPTEAMIEEGGYESAGFFKYASLDTTLGLFKANIEKKFSNWVAELFSKPDK